jgi:hypothetical protein
MYSIKDMIDNLLKENKYKLPNHIPFSRVNLQWWSLGKEFGYPECCIENFIKLANKGQAPYMTMMFKYGYKVREFHNKFSYVPCDDCLRRFINA